MHDAFGHGEEAKARFWPNLEDVFTNIDMAANTGSPFRLRTCALRLENNAQSLARADGPDVAMSAMLWLSPLRIRTGKGLIDFSTA